MTPQETQALNEFLSQLTQVGAIQKDAEADAAIAAAVARQPNAAYLLVQRAMMLDQAVKQASARIAQLEAQAQTQAQTQAKPSGFLDSANDWGRHAPAAEAASAARPNAGGPGYGLPPQFSGQPAPAPMQAAPMQAAPAQAAPSAFGGGSFLGNVATTAAGVAAGAFLFQGIENLMGHRGGAWGSGGGWGQSMPMNAPMNAPLETTTINNYTTINEAPRGEPAHRDAATETRYADNGGADNNYATETSYADNGDFSADDGAAFGDDGVFDV
ncbi:MAG: DUF2076 domain-containing protein [Candidatus Protistobacter heckmanni]|nr:DUF2076 domain-containing protein [Candidatus Protistobacter heckmanni]